VDSENDSSQGFRESFANTPNSVDLMRSRGSDFHMVDSSSNSSTSVGRGGDGEDSGCGGGGGDGDRLQTAAVQAQGDGESIAWQQHLGSDDGLS
jgi:hypothetical protein